MQRSLLHSSVPPKSRSERFPSQVKDISRKMVANNTSWQQGGERNGVYALSPDKAHHITGILNAKTEENVSLLKKSMITSHHRSSQMGQKQQESDAPSNYKNNKLFLARDYAKISDESQSERHELKFKVNKVTIKSQITTDSIDVSKPTHRRQGFDDVDLMMQHQKAKREVLFY